MNWEAIGVLILIFTTVVGAGVAYLRQLIINETRTLMDTITQKMVSKEVYASDLKAVEHRLDAIERKLQL
jgi:hypothetical protein